VKFYVPAIDSESRRSSAVASAAGSLHQIYRSSPICVKNPITNCLTASSATATTSYTIVSLRHHKRLNCSLRLRRHNLQLSIGTTLLIDRNFVPHVLHMALHWLPIRQRILYKLSTNFYKCVHGAAPSYLTNLCVPIATDTSRRYLRSATHGDLQVPRTRTVTYGPRSFAGSGPTIWNTLPSTLRISTTTLGQFQSGLNTILFRLAYGT